MPKPQSLSQMSTRSQRTLCFNPYASFPASRLQGLESRVYDSVAGQHRSQSKPAWPSTKPKSGLVSVGPSVSRLPSRAFPYLVYLCRTTISVSLTIGRDALGRCALLFLYILTFAVAGIGCCTYSVVEGCCGYCSCCWYNNNDYYSYCECE